jgi:lipoprotein-releasing system permease protein
MSKLPFELLLALRYLRPKRTFVSIITLISIIGVALGVAVLIIVISVMSGFDHDLREKILGFNSHLQVFSSSSSRSMPDYVRVAGIIASNKNVRGVSPLVMGKVLVETQAETNQQAQADAPILRGVDPQAEGSVSILPQSIVEGKFDLSGHGVVVGSGFAHNLGLRVGDRLSISSPHDLEQMRKNHGKENEEVAVAADYEVRGIFDVGYYEFNNLFIITSLENAQDLYDLGDSVHVLEVMLADPNQAAEVKKQLEQTLGDGFAVTTWMEQNATMLNAILVEKKVMLYIMFFIVVVAAFGITCTLITFVVMKTSEIGLMKAVGASHNQVMFVFVIQSVIVSVFGVAAGLGLGLFALYLRNDFLHLMDRLTGFELFPASIYGFSELPALIVPSDIVIICGGSLVICLMAAILPARHASKMNTVEALRHE